MKLTDPKTISPPNEKRFDSKFELEGGLVKEKEGHTDLRHKAPQLSGS